MTAPVFELVPSGECKEEMPHRFWKSSIHPGVHDAYISTVEDEFLSHYSQSEAEAWVEDVQIRSDRLIEAALEPRIAKALTLMDITGPATLAHLGQGDAYATMTFALGEEGLTLSEIRLVEHAVRVAYARLSDPRLKPWCDIAALLRDHDKLEKTGVRSRTDDEATYQRELHRVLEMPMVRRVADLPRAATILALGERFPNFAAPLQFVAEQAALSRLRVDQIFRLPPMLLVGSPGIGKTYLAKSLAELLGSRVEVLSMSGASAGFALSGMDRGWSTARAGVVYSTIAEGISLAPVLVLDEIDKVVSESRSDPLGALYQLLEPMTASRFRDEYVGFSIDASHIVWIATANDLDQVPAALRSRFRVFHIEEPNTLQMREIASNLYRNMVQDLPGTNQTIPDTWFEPLNGLSVRDMRLALQQAFGRAAVRAELAGKTAIELNAADLECNALPSARKRIGFVG